MLYNAGMNDCGADRLAVRIVVALHAVESQLESALEPLGLSLPKLGVLSKLVDAGEPLPLRTLAERCSCVRSNITQLVDRLEADKLVLRADDPHDRRSIRAELTAEGRARHAAGFRALERAEKELLADFSERQRDDLLRLLKSLVAAAG
jgi:DNA-binding MarR family transcriptional regulator